MSHQSKCTERFSICVSKVIRDCIGFALLCSVIGLENSRHPLSLSDAKLKQVATWSLAFQALEHEFYFEFSLAPCDIHLCFDWSLRLL